MIKFPSMPNFRKLTVNKEKVEKVKIESTISQNSGCENNERWDTSLGSHKIYRSSKPDYMTEEDVSRFCNLNFQTIIDLRSYEEYIKGEGDKLLDYYYPLYKVKVPQWRNYEIGEKLVFKKLKSSKKTFRPVFYNPNTASDETPLLDSDNDSSTIETSKRHILINFFNYKYIWTIFNRISIFGRFISLFIFAFDLIFRTDKRYFVRFFVKKCLNARGVKGLYVDIVDLAQAPICAALKLLTVRSNVPVMLNCAHGKDRTGIVSALILSILGYSKEHIVNNFTRSVAELEPIRAQVIADTVERMHVNVAFAGAEAETIEYVLAHIDEKYGGVTSYLEKIGFPISDQNLLRKNLSGGADDG